MLIEVALNLISAKMLQLLVCDLIEAEQQSTLAHRAHLQLVDHLLNVHKSRLAELESHWNTSVGELSTEYNTERYADPFPIHSHTLYIRFQVYYVPEFSTCHNNFHKT